MGCTASRLDANGVMMPAKIRPFFLPRLTPGNRPLKDSTPSKKELLAPPSPEDSLRGGLKPMETRGKRDEDTKEEASNKESYVNNKNGTIYEAVKQSSPRMKDINNSHEDNTTRDVKVKEEAKMAEASTDTEFEDEDDDDGDDDERMIGHGGFPGSPSFRVYCKDNEEKDHKDIGKNDALQSKAISSDDATICSKDHPIMPPLKKKEQKRRRSFKKVLPKNWNMTSCYTSSHHGRGGSHLLEEKTAS